MYPRQIILPFEREREAEVNKILANISKDILKGIPKRAGRPT
jgi:hypothetical protein